MATATMTRPTATENLNPRRSDIVADLNAALASHIDLAIAAKQASERSRPELHGLHELSTRSRDGPRLRRCLRNALSLGGIAHGTVEDVAALPPWLRCRTANSAGAAREGHPCPPRCCLGTGPEFSEGLDDDMATQDVYRSHARPRRADARSPPRLTLLQGNQAGRQRLPLRPRRRATVLRFLGSLEQRVRAPRTVTHAKNAVAPDARYGDHRPTLPAAQPQTPVQLVTGLELQRTIGNRGAAASRPAARPAGLPTKSTVAWMGTTWATGAKEIDELQPASMTASCPPSTSPGPPRYRVMSDEHRAHHRTEGHLMTPRTLPRHRPNAQRQNRRYYRGGNPRARYFR
jgi:hypothetical protein